MYNLNQGYLEISNKGYLGKFISFNEMRQFSSKKSKVYSKKEEWSPEMRECLIEIGLDPDKCEKLTREDFR